jgi:hypothetical protein
MSHVPHRVCSIAHNSGLAAKRTRQHNVVPDAPLVADVTHVALAFMRSDIFNRQNVTEWPLFTTVDEVRGKFSPGTKVMVAIGGWGDTQGFSVAAVSEKSRGLFARNVRRMLDDTGADGMCFSVSVRIRAMIVR